MLPLTRDEEGVVAAMAVSERVILAVRPQDSAIRRGYIRSYPSARHEDRTPGSSERAEDYELQAPPRESQPFGTMCEDSDTDQVGVLGLSFGAT